MLYLIVANFILIIGYLLYTAVFRKLTFFQWNRWYLLSVMLYAAVVPIISYIDLSSHVPLTELPTIHLAPFSVEEIGIESSKSWSWYDVLSAVYWTGVALSFAWLMVRLYKVFQVQQNDDAYRSSSFLNSMILGQKVKSNHIIQQHEQVHIDQRHSYDILLIEVMKCFHWFNPIVYSIQKEIKFQHECIADQICGTDRVSYAKLLVSHALKVADFQLDNQFSNYSFLKKRIMMLFKEKSKNSTKTYYLSIVPVLLICVLTTLVLNTSKAKALVTQVENNIKEGNFSIPTVSSTVNTEEAIVVNNEEDQTVTTPPQLIALTLENRETQPTLERIHSEKNIKLSSSINTNLRKLPTDTTKREARITLKVTGESDATPAEPVGGLDAFRKWIADTFVYPQEAVDAGAKGTIEAIFVVETDGSLSDIKILRDIDYGTGDAYLKVLEQSKKWKPAIKNGSPVRTQFRLPIRLDLSRQ